MKAHYKTVETWASHRQNLFGRRKQKLQQQKTETNSATPSHTITMIISNIIIYLLSSSSAGVSGRENPLAIQQI